MLNSLLFIIIVTLGLLGFLLSCYAHFRLLRLGTRVNRLDHLGARFVGLLRYAFGQRRVLRLRDGWNHLLLFYALLALLPANIVFLWYGRDASFGLDALPLPLIMLSDIAAVIVLLSVIIMLARHLFSPLRRHGTINSRNI